VAAAGPEATGGVLDGGLRRGCDAPGQGGADGLASLWSVVLQGEPWQARSIRSRGAGETEGGQHEDAPTPTPQVEHHGPAPAAHADPAPGRVDPAQLREQHRQVAAVAGVDLPVDLQVFDRQPQDRERREPTDPDGPPAVLQVEADDVVTPVEEHASQEGQPQERHSAAEGGPLPEWLQHSAVGLGQPPGLADVEPSPGRPDRADGCEDGQGDDLAGLRAGAVAGRRRGGLGRWLHRDPPRGGWLRVTQSAVASGPATRRSSTSRAGGAAGRWRRSRPAGRSGATAGPRPART
jgi:hypothetical protein